jgi:hypothetical protein
MQRLPLRVALVVSVFSALVFAITTAIHVHSAPAQAVADPPVDILVVLPPPRCIMTHYSQDGVPVDQTPCVGATLMKTQTVSRSQAIALNEPYALRPSSGASATAWQTWDRQLKQIEQMKRNAQPAMGGRIPKFRPSRPMCLFNPVTVSTYPTIDGDQLDMWVTYQENQSDCSKIYLMEAAVQGITSPNILYLHDGTYYSCTPFDVDPDRWREQR